MSAGSEPEGAAAVPELWTAEQARQLLALAGVPAAIHTPQREVATSFAHETCAALVVPADRRGEARAVLMEAWGEEQVAGWRQGAGAR